jgi:hypothetical protein
MSHSFSSKLMPVILVIVLALAVPGSGALAQGNRTIYEDTFAANVSGWALTTTENSLLTVTGGALTLQTTAAGQASWATPAVTIPDDVVVAVEATPVSPASNGEWNVGLILRADTRGLDASFYHFGVTGTGRWEFRGRPKEAKSYSTAIKSGKLDSFDPSSPIELKVEARGDTFNFLVNGTSVGTFQDASISGDPLVEKYLGLMTGTYENADASKVKFKKLVVTEGSTARVLLQETFSSDNPNNWGTLDAANDHIWIENNAIHLAEAKPTILVYTSPKITLPADVDVTVSAEINSLNSDSNKAWYYGVGVRAFVPDQKPLYYFFELDGAGYYAFTVRTGGQITRTVIGATKLDFDPYVKNTLRVVAQGDTFTLYLNGVQLDSVTDISLDTSPTYSVVLVAANDSDSSQVEAVFSDLIVTAP